MTNTDRITTEISEIKYDALNEAFRTAMDRGDREAFERVRMSLEEHDLDRDYIIRHWLTELVIDEAEAGVSSRSRYDEVTIETENFTATYTLEKTEVGWVPDVEATYIHDQLDAEVLVGDIPSRNVRNKLDAVCKEKNEYTPKRDHPSLTAAERNPGLARGDF